MSETFITVIVVITVALVMFIFPVMATADQNDSITQSSVQAMVSEFVNTAAKEGTITASNYSSFIQKLHATGNTYHVELEVQHIDDNPGNKGTNIDAIGENIYYSVFTNEILEGIEDINEYKLNKGDFVKAKVQNTNITFGTQMKNFFYKLVGKDTVAIEASSSALVTTTREN